MSARVLALGVSRNVELEPVSEDVVYKRREPDWARFGACYQRRDPRFFPEERKTAAERDGVTALAKQTCFSCAVRPECFEWIMALEARDEVRMREEDGENVASLFRTRCGVFAGLDAEERVQAADEGWTTAQALLHTDLAVLGIPKDKQEVAS